MILPRYSLWSLTLFAGWLGCCGRWRCFRSVRPFVRSFAALMTQLFAQVRMGENLQGHAHFQVTLTPHALLIVHAHHSLSIARCPFLAQLSSHCAQQLLDAFMYFNLCTPGGPREKQAFYQKQKLIKNHKIRPWGPWGAPWNPKDSPLGPQGPIGKVVESSQRCRRFSKVSKVLKGVEGYRRLPKFVQTLQVVG